MQRGVRVYVHCARLCVCACMCCAKGCACVCARLCVCACKWVCVSLHEGAWACAVISATELDCYCGLLVG